MGNSFPSCGGLLFRIAGPAREELAQTSLERRRLFLASLRALRARGGRGGAPQHGLRAGFAPRVGRVSIEKRSARLRPASLGAPRGRDLVSPGAGARKIVTWLILPVVICLSQRLSHACLSITFILGNCEWLIKSVIVYLMVLYSDNRRNSRANTCANPDFWKGRIY